MCDSQLMCGCISEYYYSLVNHTCLPSKQISRLRWFSRIFTTKTATIVMIFFLVNPWITIKVFLPQSPKQQAVIPDISQCKHPLTLKLKLEREQLSPVLITTFFTAATILSTVFFLYVQQFSQHRKIIVLQGPCACGILHFANNK